MKYEIYCTCVSQAINRVLNQPKQKIIFAQHTIRPVTVIRA